MSEVRASTSNEIGFNFFSLHQNRSYPFCVSLSLDDEVDLSISVIGDVISLSSNNSADKRISLTFVLINYAINAWILSLPGLF